MAINQRRFSPRGRSPTRRGRSESRSSRSSSRTSYSSRSSYSYSTRSRSRSRGRSRSRSPNRNSSRYSRPEPVKKVNKSVLVKNLTLNVNKNHLLEIFEGSGKLTVGEMTAGFSKDVNSRTQSATLEFEELVGAEKAIKEMHGGVIDGVVVEVVLIKDQPPQVASARPLPSRADVRPRGRFSRSRSPIGRRLNSPPRKFARSRSPPRKFARSPPRSPPRRRPVSRSPRRFSRSRSPPRGRVNRSPPRRRSPPRKFAPRSRSPPPRRRSPPRKLSPPPEVKKPAASQRDVSLSPYSKRAGPVQPPRKTENGQTTKAPISTVKVEPTHNPDRRFVNPQRLAHVKF